MQRHHKADQPADVYRYDGLYQLVDVWYGADATNPANITTSDLYQTYDLDTLGNRLVVSNDGAGQSYGPQAGGQLTNSMNRYETVDTFASLSASAATLAYDARGNTLDDGINSYAYDVLNRQTIVTNTAAITTEYIYDARGRRVAKVTAGVTITHYLYDIQYRVLEERGNSGELLALYTYGAGIDEPLTMERNGQTYYYHRDVLGSVTELSDASGAIVERYEYDVYGAVTIYDAGWITRTMSAVGNVYLFTGRQFDPESGNYYYRARVYSPALGRFLSMDPLGIEAGDYNLYRYAFNNPTTLTDPTGEFAFIPWLLSASAQAAADALMQALFNYFFDPNITTVDQAFQSIDYGQVGMAFLTGLLPGGRWLRSLAGAAGDVILYVLDAQADCREPSLADILSVFALGLGAEVIGDYVGDAVAKYGARAVAKGLRKLGLDELAEKILRQVDDAVDIDPCSFSEDTLVSTEDGLMSIDQLDVGDYVLAYDEETGEIAFYPVTAVMVHTDPVIVLLTIDGEVIETTPEHPFYTTEGEWVPAGALLAGDEVLTAGGRFGIVQAVELARRPQLMYNLTVAEAHTFFVGDGQWLVHNMCPVPNWTREVRVSEILKTRKGSIRQAPLPAGSPSWDDIADMTWGEILDGAGRNKPGYKTIKKLLTDKRFAK